MSPALEALSAEVDSFSPFPRLRQHHENEHINKDNGPLPADTRVHENNMVQSGDIQRREDDQKDDGHRVEEELVPPEMSDPGFEALGHLEQ